MAILCGAAKNSLRGTVCNLISFQKLLDPKVSGTSLILFYQDTQHIFLFQKGFINFMHSMVSSWPSWVNDSEFGLLGRFQSCLLVLLLCQLSESGPAVRFPNSFSQCPPRYLFSRFALKVIKKVKIDACRKFSSLLNFFGYPNVSKAWKTYLRISGFLRHTGLLGSIQEFQFSLKRISSLVTLVYSPFTPNFYRRVLSFTQISA